MKFRTYCRCINSLVSVQAPLKFEKAKKKKKVARKEGGYINVKPFLPQRNVLDKEPDTYVSQELVENKNGAKRRVNIGLQFSRWLAKNPEPKI